MIEITRGHRAVAIAAAVVFAGVTMLAGYRAIGLPPVVIVGGSSVIALVMWIRTYLPRPLDPEVILPPFLLTVAALEIRRVPLAGFLAWFIFIGPGVAEFTHFIFPLLEPAILPDLPGAITQAVSNGRVVGDMRNYWVRTTGEYYFPGLYTAVLPMIPGIWAIRRVVRAAGHRH